MAADMMHRDERLVHRERERLAEVCADEQRTDQSRRAGRSDCIHLMLIHLRVRKRLLGHADNRLHVAARGDLGHDAAVKRVRRDLRVDNIFRPSSMTAAAVSSQEDSIASILKVFTPVYRFFSKQRQFSAPAGLP